MPQQANTGTNGGRVPADQHRTKVAVQSARMALTNSQGRRVEPVEVQSIAVTEFMTDLTRAEAVAGIRAALLPENVTELRPEEPEEPDGVAGWSWKTKLYFVGPLIAAWFAAVAALWFAIRFILVFASLGIPGWGKAVIVSAIVGAVIRLSREGKQVWLIVKARFGSFRRWAEERS